MTSRAQRKEDPNMWKKVVGKAERGRRWMC